jgi:hypothetical protein
MAVPFGWAGVDALVWSDAVAGHGLPHGQFENLHIERVKNVGHGYHGVGDGEPAGVRRQRSAHAVFRLCSVEPEHAREQRAQVGIGNPVGIGHGRSQRGGNLRKGLGRTIEHLRGRHRCLPRAAPPRGA